MPGVELAGTKSVTFEADVVLVNFSVAPVVVVSAVQPDNAPVMRAPVTDVPENAVATWASVRAEVAVSVWPATVIV